MEYEPKWEKDVETSPDRRPSDSLTVKTFLGDRFMLMLEVRGLGVLLFTSNKIDPATGRVLLDTLWTATKDEINA